MTATARESRDLVGDVQRFGLFSAATVVDRYAVLVDRVLATTVPRPDGRAQGAPADTAVQVAEAALRLLDSASALLGASGPTSATETLVLPSTATGGTAGTALWVHNATPSAVPAVGLRVTALVSASGDSVPAGAVSLAPDAVDVAAGGAREVGLSVLVPAGQAPGHYHGLVLSSAAPDQPLLLQLEVLRAEEPGP